MRPVSVIELAGYRRRADELLSQAEQDAVIDLVAYEPTCGDLIPATGGLRKVRVGRAGMGKRGGARIVYFFHNTGHSYSAARHLCEKRKKRPERR